MAEEKIIKKIEKKTAVAKGMDLPISLRHSKEICRTIKNMTPEKARELLEKVRIKRKVVKIRRGKGHRKGFGSAFYPVKASGYIIKVIEQLKANALAKNLGEIRIKIAKADKASSPVMRKGRLKRCHVLLIGEEK